ncbi:Type 1 glutamine amidotransferase-like domain-containing protein [uncultured Sphingomonas sp.]|uniref:Type 1 glutamine amidotransferase-like domain-containing protein n=1 Tax=uncultured Sphingomonas sp. TaxID=158754 RepID=UPI0035C9634A
MADNKANIGRRGFLSGGTVAAAGLLASGTAEAASQRAGSSLRAAQPTIFATGGGFFPQAWEPSCFPEYLLALTRATNPKVCWLGPASGESAAGFESFARGMEEHPCQVRHFNIYQPATLDFVDYMMGMDIVFVGGGSTKNMMALWREWGFDKALHAAWQAGVVMSGGSAGLICWFQSGLTDSFPKVLAPVRALGFLPGSTNPHYHIRPDRVTRYQQFIADGSLDSPGLALDQDVGALYHGTDLVELVSAKKEAGAWRLTRTATGFDEVRLPVRYLGA